MQHKIFLSLAFIFISVSGKAQIQQNQLENFLTGVQLVDDFFKRFNFAEDMFDGYKALSESGSDLGPADYKSLVYGDENVGRLTVLLSLFDAKSIERIGRANIKNFVLQVSDTSNPVHIDFYGDNWYAEVSCTVQYKGSERKLTLILKNQLATKDDLSSYWAIAACQADFLKLPTNQSGRKGVNSGSHGIDFITLDNAFKEKGNVGNLPVEGFDTDQLSILLYAVHTGDITFQHVKEVKYHFLQVDNWIFTVETYRRGGNNSGWLISDLVPADLATKETYQKNKLYLR